jgi:hypothetical protein
LPPTGVHWNELLIPFSLLKKGVRFPDWHCSTSRDFFAGVCRSDDSYLIADLSLMDLIAGSSHLVFLCLMTTNPVNTHVACNRDEPVDLS